MKKRQRKKNAKKKMKTKEVVNLLPIDFTFWADKGIDWIANFLSPK